ncbi:MAG: hypothetical protein HOJ64_04880 [Euryarchaeota archaeon]|nr:hypothetical protein [Euryarchaeota archaeon]MBT4392256.1 hypothetical protein [Euryarchaeota archaeon]MBT4803292.1 hypothetical protein [Euryarchaeota archaeon]MBT5614189.1 hypothetical protein [Euryarchaeota archaeon]
MVACGTCGMDGVIESNCQLCGGLIIDAKGANNLLQKTLIIDEKNEKSSKLKFENINQTFSLPFGIDNAPQYAISISIPFGIELAPK